MNPAGQLIGFAAVAISAVIYLQKDRKHILAVKLLTEVFGVSVSVLMLAYGAYNNSAATVVNELIVLSSIAVSEIKFKIKYYTVKKELKNAER
ncbi:MAG: hypothetical protein UHO61_01335 [Acutalibacteraceae bacterium]|nr:hypothetical protein [Acutalibacteraceae bacterium]